MPLLAVVATYALFLPLLGPLADHHFAERRPSHGHIYSGDMPAQHLHPYETTHVHDGTTGASIGLEVTGGSSSGIIILPPNDEGTAGATGLGIQAALLAVLAVLVIPPALKRRFSQRGMAVRPFIARLLTPPPRPAW